MIKVSGVRSRNQKWELLNSITARLAVKDPSIWGKAAEAEAAIRLDWIDLPESSRELLPTLDALSAWSRELGHTNYILCGMGGSSLAPEVIARHFRKSLLILDSTDPDQVSDALACDLSKSCVIVASKSGGTIETASQKALFEDSFQNAGLDPRNHMVVITDPGSPLHNSAKEEGFKVILANPKVGGRFSALSAFGLTPAALIGVDISLLLDDALDAAREFVTSDSSVVAMAALLSEKEFAFPAFYDGNSEFPGLADWIEQLVAESTGKDGRGVLPVVLAKSPKNLEKVITFVDGNPLSVVGPLGAQFLFWEWVTALLCYLLEVDPFNQPNVAESKERTGKLLTHRGDEGEVPAFATDNIEFYSNMKFESINEYLRYFASGRYVALMAYLNRNSERDIVSLRDILESKTGKPITFGWGPRFLHSTGQFHKGGPLVGSFIQITGASEKRVEIPGQSFSFNDLILAQALGDLEALKSRSLPALRIHLKSRRAGITELLEEAKKL